MSEVIVSAPGKVIIHGEHAVVYGMKAVAAAINLRTFLKLVPNQDQKHVTVRLPDIKLSREYNVIDIQQAVQDFPASSFESSDINEDIVNKLKSFAGIGDNISDTQQLAVIAFLYLYVCITDRTLPLNVEVRSQLFPGAGLGSSAAFSTCLAASLLVSTKRVENKPELSASDRELINKWAFQGEKIIHGRPSGIDNSVSTFGGAVILQKGQLSFLDTIPQLRALLVNTKVPRSTKVLVAGVREKYNKYTSVIAPILDAIEAISDQSIKVYGEMTEESNERSYEIIGDMIEMNQKLLELIGVSHPTIEEVNRIAKSHGLFSKLTGAGGGGCVFAVVPPNVDEMAVVALTEEVKKCGYDCWETSIGANGVKCHSVDESFESLLL